MATKNVLIVDDDPATLDFMRLYVESEGYEVATAGTGEEALRLADSRRFDISLTDLQLPDLDGIELVKRLRDVSPDTEIIMVSGHGSVTRAVEATKAGAFYFVEKPVAFEELTLLMEKAIERRQQAQEIRRLRDRLTNRTSYYNLIGGSKAMQTVYELIDSVAESDANVFITGESGTGKELVASAVHFKSLRAKKPMMKVNCAALPKELIESELFGHTKGAFTGATAEKAGVIGQAEGGTLFLDEIGEMPLELQPKLLRVLQERAYSRLGSTKVYESNFRLISATNRDPLDAVRDGQLREDLYYRINTIEIRMPPLRERAEDIQRLAEHFLHEFAEKYGRPARSFLGDVYERLFEYNWPGNVRELRNVVERAVLLSKGETIDASALPFVGGAGARSMPEPAPSRESESEPASRPEPPSRPVAPTMPSAPPSPAVDDMSIDQLGKAIIEKIAEPNNGQESESVFEQLERVLVRHALERTKGNKQAAANLLGVYRPRLYHMIRKHDLSE
jgi:DNA-binding NtrC family response regulator